MPSPLRRVAAAAGIFLVQWLVLGRLSVYGSMPDAVLLFVAWSALHTNRRAGALMGFGLGFVMDVVYGTWGTHMLVKTIVGFLLGTFALDERESLLIQPQQAFLGSLVIALLHNGLLVTLLALQTTATNNFLVSALWLGSAVYTAAVGTLAAFVSS